MTEIEWDKPPWLTLQEDWCEGGLGAVWFAKELGETGWWNRVEILHGGAKGELGLFYSSS